MASPSSSTSVSPTHSPSSPQHKLTTHSADDPSILSAPPVPLPVPLPRLVTHLIAAKRALSATAHVERADILVSTARSYVEDIAALAARNSFLNSHVQRELRILEGIRRRLDGVAVNGGAEFKAVLRTLDASDNRVKHTLHLLKTTVVESSFQSRSEPPSTATDPDFVSATSSPPAPTNKVAKGDQKCLYDFVAEQGVDDLAQVFRQCIDATNDATETFIASNEAFDAELQVISDLLSSASPSATGLQTNQPRLRSSVGESRSEYRNTESDEQNDTAESLFRALESHATEMASLLESLVRHYDLCVTALKHTEGGGEAAAQAEAHVDIPGGLAELDRSVPHEPISDEERNQMVGVLEKDALEVEDVVQEIRDYGLLMERHLEILSNRLERLKGGCNGLNAAVSLLDALSKGLPGYIRASTTFLDKWSEQKANIEQNMDELEALRDFYDGFLRAYDGLILEIGRRKLVQAKMEKVVADAMAKVSKLYEEDKVDREAFRLEQGEYLPADIWPGLVDSPAKFEIRRSDQEGSVLPEISKETMQRASQRRGKST